MICIMVAIKHEYKPLLRVIQRDSIRWVISGMGPHRAMQAVQSLPSTTPLIISTGCCGGIANDICNGDLIIPERILADESVLNAMPNGFIFSSKSSPLPAPAAHLVQQAQTAAGNLGLTWHAGALVTTAKPLCTPEEKRTAHQRFGAIAVDMETAAIAQMATARAIPYLSIRVVLDDVNESLPPPTSTTKPATMNNIIQLPSMNKILSMYQLKRRLDRVGERLGQCIDQIIDSF